MSINIGALIGGLTVPIVVGQNPFAGYMIPVVVFAVGISVFILGSARYTKMKPQGKANLAVIAITGKAICGFQGLEKQRESNGGSHPDVLVSSVRQLAAVFPVSALCIPFNILYGQMLAMIGAQGIVMKEVSFIDAAWMQNFDSIAVIIAGFVIGGWFYPFYEKKTGKPMCLAHKFAFGTFLATLGMVYGLLIDVFIIKVYNESGSEVNILWQSPAFILIGFGEIFAISAAYEATFLIAPKNLKALSSSVNIFFVGGLPQYLINASILATKSWFVSSNGSDDLTTLDNYTTAGTIKYFGLMIGIGVFGILVNLIPAVDRFLVRTLALAEVADKLADVSIAPPAGTKHNFPVGVFDKSEKADSETGFSDKQEAAIGVGLEVDPKPMSASAPGHASMTASNAKWASFIKHVND